MGGSSQQPVTQQTQQTRDPWSVAQPYLTEAMSTAGSNFRADVGYQPFTGSTIAPVEQSLGEGIGTIGGIARSNIAGSPGIMSSLNLGQNMIENQGLSPELKSLYQQAQGDQNPYLQSILDTSNRRIGDRINAGMSGAGRYGSGQHTDVMARALAESADPVLAQDYARRQQQMQDIATGGLQRAGQWSQLMPNLEEARYMPAQMLASAGQFYQDRDQKAVDDQIKLYNAQQARPWEQLARYNAIAGQAGGLGGTMFGSSTTPVNQPSTLQRLLGGGLAGAGIGASFGGPVGAGVGALGGGLLGLL